MRWTALFWRSPNWRPPRDERRHGLDRGTSRLEDRVAAVDEECGAGGERRLVGSEIHHRTHHLLGFGDAAEHAVPEVLLADVGSLLQVPGACGHRGAGRDRVDADAMPAEVGGHAPHQLLNATLRRA